MRGYRNALFVLMLVGCLVGWIIVILFLRMDMPCIPDLRSRDSSIP